MWPTLTVIFLQGQKWGLNRQTRLEALSLVNNKLTSLAGLENMPVSIRYLMIEGNPLHLSHPWDPLLIQHQVRLHLPKLIQLDRKEIVPIVSFGLSEQKDKARPPRVEKKYYSSPAAEEFGKKIYQWLLQVV